MEMMMDKFAIDGESKLINININDYITNDVTSYSYTYTDMYEINIRLDDELIKYMELDIYKMNDSLYLVIANVKGYRFEYIHNAIDVQFFIDFFSTEYKAINDINTSIFSRGYK